MALETTITSKPSNPSSSAEATFEFTSNRSEATFECSLDNAGFTACVSPTTYERISDGDHAFECGPSGEECSTRRRRATPGPSTLESSTPWGWIIGGIVAALAVAAGVYYLIRRRRQNADGAPPETLPDPEDPG